MNATIDPAQYTLRRPLNDRLTLYARIIGVHYSYTLIDRYNYRHR